MGVKLQFMANNVKGLQNFLKRIKNFQYLKNGFGSNEFLFLQKTHPSLADGNKWGDELKRPIFFT